MLADTKPDKMSTLTASPYFHGKDVWTRTQRDLILGGTATVDEVIGCRDDIMLFPYLQGHGRQRSLRSLETVRRAGGLAPDMERKCAASRCPTWYIDPAKK
jgi:DNA polymerase-3 subunit alpha (Gram-positive type)